MLHNQGTTLGDADCSSTSDYQKSPNRGAHVSQSPLPPYHSHLLTVPTPCELGRMPLLEHSAAAFVREHHNNVLQHLLSNNLQHLTAQGSLAHIHKVIRLPAYAAAQASPPSPHQKRGLGTYSGSPQYLGIQFLISSPKRLHESCKTMNRNLTMTKVLLAMLS